MSRIHSTLTIRTKTSKQPDLCVVNDDSQIKKGQNVRIRMKTDLRPRVSIQCVVSSIYGCSTQNTKMQDFLAVKIQRTKSGSNPVSKSSKTQKHAGCRIIKCNKGFSIALHQKEVSLNENMETCESWTAKSGLIVSEYETPSWMPPRARAPYISSRRH